ncbi:MULTISPECIES: DNA repair exonuclease [unclassified Halanaerobium]|uniref:metallophosphoesterase family protein n=1 Tax=unclassified Halanaerobium TaxID=2641197 RepID=UPI000DF1F093|nr:MULTISPECIES: DNA repair exonuclease [unclassified Halanaerobium]RCW41358.1 DNA repair exonuclease SbcCD nuclease subunit [Halanaerobium sp. MA284_MarDTE_T2]RCW79867.1 DNA repair exonuclease SbcCD nuclease subunit [Halanaerobium sp. DL-01]
MTLKILHTADIHIGMKFSNYPAGIREELVEARFTVLQDLILKANQVKTDLFIITGDLFERINISEKDILRTIKVLEDFAGDFVLIIPGNHDYDNGMMELWSFFKKNISQKIKVLNEYKAFSLNNVINKNIILYSAYCDSKHSSENRIDWIKNITFPENSLNIGLVHGALLDLSPDLNSRYFSISTEELLDMDGMDLWLLGHIHIPYPVQKKVENCKIFNSGTPEADGFDFSADSSAWIIDIDSSKNISAEKINCGSFNFLDLNKNISSLEDLKLLTDKIIDENPASKLLRLSLSGYLDEESYQQKEKYYQKLREKLKYFLIDDSDLKIKISKKMIEKEFNTDSFPYQLLIELADRFEDDQPLQLAYELIREVQK